MNTDGEHTYRKTTLPVVHDPIRGYLNVWNTPQGRMIQAISGVCGRKKEDLLDTSTLLEQLDIGDHSHLHEEAHDLAVRDMTQFCSISHMPRTKFKRCIFNPQRRFQSFANVKTTEDFIQYIMLKREQRANRPVVAANIGIYADDEETFERNFELAQADFQEVTPPRRPFVSVVRRAMKNMTARKTRRRATPGRSSPRRSATPGQKSSSRSRLRNWTSRFSRGSKTDSDPAASAAAARSSASADTADTADTAASAAPAGASGGESKVQNNIQEEKFDDRLVTPPSPSATTGKWQASTLKGKRLDMNGDTPARTASGQRPNRSRNRLKARLPRQRVDLQDVVMFQDVEGEYEPVDTQGFNALKSKYYQLLCKAHANNTLAAVLSGNDTHIPYSDEVVSAINEAWANIRANFPQLNGSFESFTFPTRRRKKKRTAHANEQVRRRLFKYIGTLIPPYSRYMARHELERIDQVQREAYENLHEALKDVVK